MNETKLELTTNLKSTEEISQALSKALDNRDPFHARVELELAAAKDGTRLVAVPNKYLRGFAVILVRGTQNYSVNGCRKYSELTLSSIMISANGYIARFLPAPAAKASSRALDILGVI